MICWSFSEVLMTAEVWCEIVQSYMYVCGTRKVSRQMKWFLYRKFYVADLFLFNMHYLSHFLICFFDLTNITYLTIIINKAALESHIWKFEGSFNSVKAIIWSTCEQKYFVVRLSNILFALWYSLIIGFFPFMFGNGWSLYKIFLFQKLKFPCEVNLILHQLYLDIEFFDLVMQSIESWTF